MEGKGEEAERLELIVKITTICMEIADGDEEQAAGILLEVTTYDFTKDGETKTVNGTRKSNDLKKYTVKRLRATYGKAKKEKEHWEKAHGPEVEEPVEAPGPDDDDIPF